MPTQNQIQPRIDRYSNEWQAIELKLDKMLSQGIAHLTRGESDNQHKDISETWRWRGWIQAIEQLKKISSTDDK